MKEDVLTILCKHDYPDMLSHHDMVLSRVSQEVCTCVPRKVNNFSGPMSHDGCVVMYCMKGASNDHNKACLEHS